MARRATATRLTARVPKPAAAESGEQRAYRQWVEVKRLHPEPVVLVKATGEWYTFDGDAEAVYRATGINYGKRALGPHTAAWRLVLAASEVEGATAKLLARGCSVGLVEPSKEDRRDGEQATA